MYVIKKDNTHEAWNVQKVVVAVNKSAYRAMVKFTQEELDFICSFVEEKARSLGQEGIPIAEMHNIVEAALEQVKPEVAKSYRDYRNYKQDFVKMLDEVYKKSQSIMYIGDKENSNSDSALVSTKRSLIYNQLNKELYQKFFMTTEELQACRDGYIYIHDMSARRDTMNCCLFCGLKRDKINFKRKKRKINTFINKCLYHSFCISCSHTMCNDLISQPIS